MTGYVREARWADLHRLAASLRPADVAEIEASSGLTTLRALELGFYTGDTRVACLKCGLPAAIFGVAGQFPEDGTAVVWMVATTRFKELHRQFLRECRWHLDDLCKPYRLVFNYTDARNTVHHRWIKWAGFTIIKRHNEFGHEGRAFLEFVRITEAHHV